MAARHRRCPTPEKVTYPTYSAALSALRRMKSGPLRPYKCRSHFHLTSRPRRRGR